MELLDVHGFKFGGQTGELINAGLVHGGVDVEDQLQLLLVQIQHLRRLMNLDSDSWSTRLRSTIKLWNNPQLQLHIPIVPSLIQKNSTPKWSQCLHLYVLSVFGDVLIRKNHRPPSLGVNFLMPPDTAIQHPPASLIGKTLRKARSRCGQFLQVSSHVATFWRSPNFAHVCTALTSEFSHQFRTNVW